MLVVILGCGRVGAAVAGTLSAEHDVTVVDWSRSAFERLPSSFGGETILGNGIDADVLREAHVELSRLFLAVTDNDNRNLMAAQVARYLGAPQVVARVYDPVRAEAFQRLGITTVSPTVHGAERLFALAIGEEET